MTKTPDEIKKGLECCCDLMGVMCPYCPYAEDGDASETCREEMAGDALVLIQQLQAENADQAVRIQQLEKRVIHLEALNQSNLTTITMQERTRARLQERISQLEAERDAAVADILYAASVYLGECNTCKNGEVCAACKRQDACDECPNSKCMCIGCGAGRSNWQWRGVQKEE